MSAKNQVTITEVAKRAGVSAQTVSRVINERPDVALETRQRVKEVISQLGYRPNALARSLIHQRSYTLGVVASGIDYYGPSQTLVGIEKQARELGYSLLLDLLHHPDLENVELILNRLLSRQVDGIIWAVAEIGNNRAWIEDTTLNIPTPMIFLTMEPRPTVTSISIDNWKGGYMATRHLLEQGYENIGIILGPRQWWEVQQRYAGWKQALEEVGKHPHERQVEEGNWSAASGKQGIDQLLEQFPEMDALFACNDQMAYGALQTIYERGWHVPENLAVVGFDNIPEAAYFWPSLTTIGQPLIELGGMAVQQLHKMIDADQQEELRITPQSFTLEPQLIVRGSSQTLQLRQKPASLNME